jgi:hypothetical protein
MRFQTQHSNSLIPNPRLDYADRATVLSAMVAEGVRLSWTRSKPAREWRIFRLDASEGTPAVLIAILPAGARSYVDRSDAPSNRYRAGHALTHRVFAAL